MILDPKKIKPVTVSTFPLPICHEVMGLDAVIFISECLALSQLFHSPLSLSSRGFLVPLHFLPTAVQIQSEGPKIRYLRIRKKQNLVFSIEHEVYIVNTMSQIPMLTEKRAQHESCKLSFIWGKMRTEARETAP